MKHFEELLQSLGSSKSSALLESKNWTLWRAEFSTPVAMVVGNYLYLKSTCPLLEANPRNLSEIRAHCGSQEYIVVVTPKSVLAKDIKNTVAKFRAKSGGTTQDLLEAHLLKGVRYRPLEREDYFVQPSVRVNGEIKPDGLSFLTRWLIGEESTQTKSPIGLLCADGGIGKTTLARELCESVRAINPRVVPLLIESAQWKGIANTGFTLDTLWDIAIAKRLENGNSLRANPAALRVLMQEGLLVVIFDGFDELAAISTEGSRAQEIISELQALFTPEDEEIEARIILTSRATYWDAISGDTGINGIVEEFRLPGFDNDQRKEYFRKRLRDAGQRDLALRIARETSGAIYDTNLNRRVAEEYNEDRISGTPFLLSLIAHLVEGGELNEPFNADSLESIIIGVCRRENIRQDLKIAPEIQFSIFEELFRAMIDKVGLDELDLILQVYDVENIDIRKRFEHHFLLQRQDVNYVVPRFEVLKIYFVARFLAKGLQKLYLKTPEKEIARILSMNATGQSQVSEWLAWQLRKLPEDQLISAVRHAYELINLPVNSGNKYKAAIALAHLVNQLVSDDDRKTRTRTLLHLMCGHNDFNHPARGLVMSGRLRSFDFSAVSFESCVFIKVDFNNCKFSDGTIFRNCVFDGDLNFINCDGAANILLCDNKLSADAELEFGKILNKRVSSGARNKFAEDAVTRALRKFRGDFGFHGIQFARRLSGPISKNPFGFVVWDVLVKFEIICRHEISGVIDGGLHVCEDKNIKREIIQYLDNGIVGEKLKYVMSELIQ